MSSGGHLAVGLKRFITGCSVGGRVDECEGGRDEWLFINSS